MHLKLLMGNVDAQQTRDVGPRPETIMYRNCTTHSDQSLCVSELAEASLDLKNRLGYSDPSQMLTTVRFGVEH